MNAQDKIEKLVNVSKGIGYTSHDMAKIAGCTPSHVRKVCKKLFSEGRAAYRIEQHPGRAGYKRIYVEIEHARTMNLMLGQQYYILPESFQPPVDPDWHEIEGWGREEF